MNKREVRSQITSDEENKEEICENAENISVEKVPINQSNSWFSSGIYKSTSNVVSGAIGMGVGGARWVAGKGYSISGGLVEGSKSLLGKIPLKTSSNKDKSD